MGYDSWLEIVVRIRASDGPRDPRGRGGVSEVSERACHRVGERIA